jgi:positive regulator of sigma E activity
MKQRTSKRQLSPRVPIAVCVMCIVVLLAFAILLRLHGFFSDEDKETWWIGPIGAFMVFGGIALGFYLEQRFRRKQEKRRK